jgi:hypothetical protein
MRYIFVPQEGQKPWVAGFPFFILTALALLISFFLRHFMQYACIYQPLLYLILEYIVLAHMSIIAVERLPVLFNRVTLKTD